MKHLLLSLAVVALLASCDLTPKTHSDMDSTESNEKQEKVMAEQKPTLKDALDQRKNASGKKANPEKKRIYAEGIEAVEQSGVTKSAKQVGDKAPDFELTDALGNKVKLSERLKNGPVILTWYRGGWCPYCNITLSRLQQELPQFKAAGAELIALTPELPDSSMNTAEKNALDFRVLSDVGSAVARDYGVLYKLTDEVADIYNASFALDTYNGDDAHELPLAATYVIDKAGTIRYAFLDADYRNRAEPTQILEALNSLNDSIN